MNNPYYVTVAIARMTVATEEVDTEEGVMEEGTEGVLPTVADQDIKALGTLVLDIREVPTTTHTNLATITTDKGVTATGRIMGVETLAEIVAHVWAQYAACAAVWTASLIDALNLA